MAGDWIKMRRGLRHEPKVIAMARHLASSREFMSWWTDPQQMSCDTTVTEVVTFSNVTRVTVAGLLDVWASVNRVIKSDGRAEFMELIDLDDIAEIPGFGEAMASVGWVKEHETEGLVFPNFGENNTPEKERPNAKTDADRAREYRNRKKEKNATSDTVTNVTSRHTDKIRIDNKSKQSNAGAEIPSKNGSDDLEISPKTHETPTVDQVKAYAKSGPVPISEACAIAFFDTQQAAGWVLHNGRSIADWRALLRRYASRWNEFEKSKGNPTARSFAITPPTKLEKKSWE